MALLLYGPLARAASWARSKHGTAAAQVLVSEGMHALKAQALEEFWGGAQQDETDLHDAVVPLLSHTDHDADFEGAVRSFDCKDALAMETEVDDVVMDSGCCETETLLEGGVRLPEPKATPKSGADGGDSCEDEALNGVELGPGAIDDGDDEDIEVKCPDCGTIVNGGTECPVCNGDGKGGVSAQNDGGVPQHKRGPVHDTKGVDSKNDGGVQHDKNDLEDDVMAKGQTPPGGVRVSDSEAEAFVRIVHQRQGCRPVRLIKEDLRNGNLEGPFITDEQFADLNLSCETCIRVRALMRRGPVRRRSLRARHVRRRILEEVAVDIVGPRRLPSLRYHTGAGSKFGGGNRYLVLFVDSATQMLFIDFMSEKSQLEAVVRDMRRRMEIEAKGSVEYDGRHPIQVGCWKSDRDSNLTSDEAVADMLNARVKHRMTAADAKNQTPLLDNRVRRLLDLMRVFLDGSGLPLEYWEVAARHAVDVINTEAVQKHPLKHSPLRQWTGRAIDKSHVLTFGCDVYPYAELDKRPNKDKVDPVAPGGNGRWRWVGVHRLHGAESRGSLIFNTKTRTMRVMKNFKVNENMAHVRTLPEPEGNWEDTKEEPEEEWYQGLFDIGSGEKVAPDEAAEKVLLRDGAEDDMPELTDASSGEEDTDDEGAESKAEGGVHTPKKAKRSGHRGPRGAKRTRNRWIRWDQGQRIAVQKVNPKRPGGKSHARFDKYMGARTVTEFLQLGGTWADLKNDSDRGYIIKGVPDSSLSWMQLI